MVIKQKAVENFLKLYNQFVLTETTNKWVLSGEYNFKGVYENIKFEDYFNLKIIISKNTSVVPVVIEEGRIGNYHHIFTDGSLCLEIPIKIKVFLDENNYDLTSYFDEFIDPYLYSYLYFEQYNEMPFGERSHNLQGYIEYFQEIFNLTDKDNVNDFLEYIVEKDNYRGHHQCPCGSLKKARNCHKDIIINFFNKDNKILKEEIKMFLKNLKKGVPNV